MAKLLQIIAKNVTNLVHLVVLDGNANHVLMDSSCLTLDVFNNVLLDSLETLHPDNAWPVLQTVQLVQKMEYNAHLVLHLDSYLTELV
jgi:hypothetical protein